MLLPTAYLPPVSWCSAFWSANKVVLEACEHYQKGSTRNRAFLAGPNGVLRLSIPLVKGKHQQTAIREVRIAYDEPWQRQHWRTIRTCYGNAPYFEHYADEMQQFYEKRYAFLFDFNFEIIQFILIKKMGWTGEIALTEVFEPAPGLRPKQEGTGMKYPQVFEDKHGFITDLSVLDLLFCCGKHGGAVLEKPFLQE